MGEVTVRVTETAWVTEKAWVTETEWITETECSGNGLDNKTSKNKKISTDNRNIEKRYYIESHLLK
jgi:hypothetical protein